MTEQAETRAAKDRLLDATIDYVAEHGLADLSLRRLAAAIGTSHRMLIYHFGSKEGLLVEVVRAVELREIASLENLDLEAGGDERELMRRMWRRLSQPQLWPQERLFFAVYVQALSGAGAAEFVESWLRPVAATLARRRGVTMAVARAEARLRLAVVRGLLLDLLATRDRASVNRAYEQYLALCTPGQA